MLVSREEDLKRMSSVWKEATKQGKLLIMLGPEGSGKNTLVRNFAKENEIEALYYRCEEEDRYIPLGLLKKLAMLYFPDIFRARSKYNTIFKKIVFELKELGPVIVHISNIHFGDNLSLKFLEYFTVHAPAGVLLVVSFPTTAERKELDALLEKLTMNGMAEVFVLSNVDSGSIETFVGNTDIPRTPEEIYRITSGNMENLDLLLTCWKLKNKVIRSKKDGYKCLYNALTKQERDILKVGSVMGNLFDINVIKSIVPELHEQAIQSLIDKYIITEFSKIYRFKGRKGYLFTNDRFRRFVYSNMVEDKKAMHDKVARYIEKHKMYTSWEKVFELARHYMLAEAPKKAIMYLKEASQIALEYNDYVSVSYYLSNLERFVNMENDNLARVEIYTELINAWAKLGNTEKSIEYASKLHAFSLLEKAWVHRNVGEYREAIQECKEVRKLGDLYLSMVAYGIEADSRAKLGLYKSALKLQKKNVELADKIGNVRELAVGLKNLGNIYMWIMRYEDSEQYYHRAMRLFRKLRDMKGMSAIYNNLGIIYANRGKRKRALNYYKKSLDIAEMLGDYDGIATAYNNMGTIYENTGDFYNAVSSYRKTIDYSFLSGNMDGMNYGYGNLGALLMETGNFRDALLYLQKHMTIAERMGSVKFMISARIHLTNLYYYLKKYDLAMKYANEAIELGRKYKNIYDASDAYYHIARIKYATGNELECVKWAEKSLEVYRKLGIEDEASHIYALLARCKGRKIFEEMERVVKIYYPEDQFVIWMARIIVLARENKEHWAYLESLVEGLKRLRYFAVLADFLEEYYSITGYESIRLDIEKLKENFVYPEELQEKD